MRFSIRTRGFSLFEMLITAALAAILITLAWPSWRPFLTRAASQTLLTQLQQALQFARQEALLRREVITLCGSRDQETCTGHWLEGLLVWVDYSEDGKVATGQSLRVFHWNHPQGMLHWRAFPQHQQSCQFLPTGTTNHENGTFWYCSAAGQEPVWALMLSQAGHWRVRYPDRHGKLRDERGLPLPCITSTR